MTAAQVDAGMVLDRRRAGVLLHPGSLPSGKLGHDALRFLDYLQMGGFSVWQMLPLGPVGAGGSPYSLRSAFAGNPALIPTAVLNAEVSEEQLTEFRLCESAWLLDYSLFTAIGRRQRARPWWEWPAGLRLRHPDALAEFARRHQGSIRACELQQYRFHMAWSAIREQARRRGILLYGDMPMFLPADSADVWARPENFRLDTQGRATHVAGVPPDGFAEHGQCWDTPVYDWERLREGGFAWWRERLAHERRRFDLVRWDHFRGLAATWEIPVRGETSAAHGQWRAVPGRELLMCLRRELGSLPLVAENLGIITPDVEALRKAFGLPGMHVLQFAFDGSQDNPHLPANHEEQGVVYTGTHDNDTSLGWYRSLPEDMKQHVSQTLGSEDPRMPEALIRAALDSACALAVIPLQDLMGLGSEARMNTPGVAQGQWAWKFSWRQLGPGSLQGWSTALKDAGR